MKRILSWARAVCAAVIMWACAGAWAEGENAEPAHFHHVHLNTVDPEATMKFYEKVFGAVRVKYAGKTDALFTGQSFILMNKVDEPPPAALRSGIWHIGWGGVDVPSEYEHWKKQGVKIHTPLYPLGRIHVTYFQGPSDELIELNTMGHHRFAHVHLFAEDVNETTAWYARHLGLAPRRAEVPKPADMTRTRAWSNAFNCDNINFIVYGRPDFTPAPPWYQEEGGPLTEFEPSKGRAIDHYAFSYRDIEPVFERMKAAGVEIVEPIAERKEFGFKSFFVMGPDKVLIEIVEAKALPEGVWE